MRWKSGVGWPCQINNFSLVGVRFHLASYVMRCGGLTVSVLIYGKFE